MCPPMVYEVSHPMAHSASSRMEIVHNMSLAPFRFDVRHRSAAVACRTPVPPSMASFRIVSLVNLVDLGFDGFLRVAELLLDVPGELVHGTLRLLGVVVREFAPGLLGLSLDLIPLAFDLILVHAMSLSCWVGYRLDEYRLVV